MSRMRIKSRPNDDDEEEEEEEDDDDGDTAAAVAGKMPACARRFPHFEVCLSGKLCCLSADQELRSVIQGHPNMSPGTTTRERCRANLSLLQGRLDSAREHELHESPGKANISSTCQKPNCEHREACPSPAALSSPAVQPCSVVE
nr:hypothetical protein CFP56_16850 [Quercus suber]